MAPSLLVCSNLALPLIMGTDFIINLLRFCVFVREAFVLTSHISRYFLVPLLLQQVHVQRSVCRKVRFCYNDSWNVCRRNRLEIFEVERIRLKIITLWWENLQ